MLTTEIGHQSNELCHSFCNFINWNEFQRLLFAHVHTYKHTANDFLTIRFGFFFSILDHVLSISGAFSICLSLRLPWYVYVGMLFSITKWILNYHTHTHIFANSNLNQEPKKKFVFQSEKVFSMFIQDYWNQLQNWLLCLVHKKSGGNFKITCFTTSNINEISTPPPPKKQQLKFTNAK